MISALSRLSVAAFTHINFGGLGKSPDGVNVVVEDDDPHHHPHAEEHGVCVGETAAVLPATETVGSEEEKKRGGDKKEKS